MRTQEIQEIVLELFETPICSEIAEGIESSLEQNGFGERDLDNIFNSCFEYYCIQQKRPLKDAIACVEKLLILAALLKFKGNRSRAAEYLGIERNTLYIKIKKYAIESIV